jgi:hypothetical protein
VRVAFGAGVGVRAAAPAGLDLKRVERLGLNACERLADDAGVDNRDAAGCDGDWLAVELDELGSLSWRDSTSRARAAGGRLHPVDADSTRS